MTTTQTYVGFLFDLINMVKIKIKELKGGEEK